MSDKPGDLPARVAVLEEIAAATKQGIAEIRADIRRLASDLPAGLRAEHRSDFRRVLRITLSGYLGLPDVMAHGFHWF